MACGQCELGRLPGYHCSHSMSSALNIRLNGNLELGCVTAIHSSGWFKFAMPVELCPDQAHISYDYRYRIPLYYHYYLFIYILDTSFDYLLPIFLLSYNLLTPLYSPFYSYLIVIYFLLYCTPYSQSFLSLPTESKCYLYLLLLPLLISFFSIAIYLWKVCLT